MAFFKRIIAGALSALVLAASAVVPVSAETPAGSSPMSLPSPSFIPGEASVDVDAAIREQVAKYNLPRWFYYAIVQRESSFDPHAYNGRDKGLTQIGGEWYDGTAYPEGLAVPDDRHQQYGWDMGFPKFGMWVRMSQVTPMTDWRDPRQNLDRFSTGYAVPAFHLFKRLYGLSDVETLRTVAYHWNKGVHATYDPWNADYLALYDKYVGQFKPPVEREDGIWDGQPRLP